MDDHIIETSEEVLNEGLKTQRKGPLKRNAVFIAIGTLLLVINLLKFFVLGYEVYFKILVISIWLIVQVIYRFVLLKSKDSTKNYFIGVTNGFLTALFAVVLFCSNIIPFGIVSHSGWNYGIQKRWAEKSFGYDMSTFPDKMPEKVSDYKLEAIPSYLQGTGHFAVNFSAEDAVISAYESECSEKAIQSFDFTEMNLHVYSSGAENMSVYYDDSIWKGHEKGTVVYVMADSKNYNHPDNSVVMINRKDGMITFSKLG